MDNNDGYWSPSGDFKSFADVKALADQAGLSLEEYIKSQGFTNKPNLNVLNNPMPSVDPTPESEEDDLELRASGQAPSNSLLFSNGQSPSPNSKAGKFLQKYKVKDASELIKGIELKDTTDENLALGKYLLGEGPENIEEDDESKIGFSQKYKTKAADISYVAEKKSIDEDLDIDYPHLYSNKNQDNSFVEKYYNSKDFAGFSKKGKFNVNDFQGFLNENGLVDDFNEKDYEKKIGVIYTGDDLENLEIAKQRKLARYLGLYINTMDSRNVDKAVINTILSSPGAYKNKLYEDVKKDIISEGNLDDPKGYFTDFDYDAIGNFNINNYSKLLKKDTEDRKKRIKKAKEHAASSTSDKTLNDVIDLGEAVYDGFVQSGLKDTSNWLEDKINIFGGKGRARQMRELQAEDELSSDNLEYFFVKGTGAEFNGVTYIKDESGNIYDTTNGFNISDTKSAGEMKNIRTAIQVKGEPMDDFNFSGGAIQGGHVLGKIMFDIIGTQGLTSSRVMASAKYMASANNFKSVDAYRKYVKLANKGKRTGKKARNMINLETFGKKLPFNAKVLDATMFQSLVGAVTGYENTLKEAKAQGLSDDEAEKLAIQAQYLMAGLYGMTGPINPRLPVLNKLDDFLNQSSAIREAVKNVTKSKKKVDFGSTMVNKINEKYPALVKTGGLFIGEGSKETLQENVQQFGETEIVNRIVNEKAGVEFLKQDYDLSDFVNTSVLSFAVGGLVGGSSNISFNSNRRSKLQNLMILGKNIDGAKARLDGLVKSKKISRRSANKILNQAENLNKYADGIPAWMLSNPDAVLDVADLAKKIDEAVEKNNKIKNPEAKKINRENFVTPLILAQNAIVQQASESKILNEVKLVKKFTGKNNIKVYKTIKEMKDAGFSIADFNSDGFMEIDGKIVINLETAAQTQAVSVASHELLHKILKSQFSGKNSDNKKILKEFKNILESKGILNLVEERLQLYKAVDGFDVGGKDMDEYFTAFSDLIAKKEIDFNSLKESAWKEIGTKIFNIIKTYLNKPELDKDFQTGRQVFDFIKDYQKNLEEGKLSDEAKAKMKKGEASKQKTKKPSLSIQQQQITAENLLGLKLKVDKNTGEKIPGDFENAAKSKEVIGKSLIGMAEVQIKNRIDNLSPNQLEEAIFDLVGRTLDDLENNPWDGRGTLSGYMAERVKFSLRDIFTDELENRRPEERRYMNKISNKELQDYKAQSKIDESNNDNITPEKPKYRKIKDSRLFSSDVITSIENKLLQTLKVLKSTVDIKTTINKSVKPVIAEIKKDMGKQADIDIKTAVGTMDTNLKENFLKAKKATLENAPTTWLSTAMPFAVQKSVGGVFTDTPIKNQKGKIVGYVFKPNFVSDWQGKKVDRVKTSTDASGNTSGKQFIQRLPNLDKRISNEQYMSYMFNKDGNLIPGKKESWSKMMGEEIAFEIFDTELNDLNSELTKAFLNNQRIRGAVLADNTIQVLKKDIERGNVKRSNTKGLIQNVKFFLKEAQKNGINQVIDENGKALIDAPFKNAIAPKIVRRAWERGLILDDKELRFMDAMQTLEELPDDIKKKLKETKALKSSSDLNLLEDFAQDMQTIMSDPRIGKEIIDIIGTDGFGFINKVLDPAETKVDKAATLKRKQKIAKDLKITVEELAKRKEGKGLTVYQKDVTGQFYNFLQEALKSMPQTDVASLPGNLDLSLVNPINSSFGIGKQIAAIQRKEIKTEEKLKLYQEYIPAIEEANLHNKILLNHIISVTYDLVAKNKIKPINAIYMLQAQTNATKGLRALSSLSYITWHDGDQGNQKGEHLADNGSTMVEIVKLLSTPDLSPAKLNNKIEDIIEFHDQWLENRELLDVIDVFGKNNPFMDLRMTALTFDQLKNVFTYNGEPALNLITTREEAIKIKVRAKKKFIAKPQSKKRSVSTNKDLNKGLNEMIARQKGVKPEAVYSKVVARKKGVNKGKYKFFLPSTAEDFRGLTQYTFAGKGKQGEADQKFFEDNLVKPYLKGISAMESQKQALKNDYSGLLKSFPKVKKILNKEIAETGFTNDQAVRIYLYNKSGFEVPGISKRDKNALLSAVNNSPDLKGFADTLQIISQRDQWVEPSEFWDVGSVLKDLNELSENVSRKDYLEEFITNVDQIFNEDNLNKVEALYGSRHREALEDIIRRMKSGSNRPGNPDRLTGAWLDWVNNSVGTIMFFNRRSALLQMLSFTNFVNWSDNNPLMAAKAFANQPAYWSAWAKIFNSDKLKQRRGGLKSDVQEQEIANQAKNAKDKYSAAVSYLLKIGFTPTQIADSMAIATGGATFLINRTNTYVKQGMSKTDAEAKAFEDFSAISDETQQSGDPMLISKQQSSHLGRLILAFQNTPMQYTRLMKKAGQDLINRRGDAKTNISKIIYYGFVQNLIFSTLQNALFALLPEFDPDDEDEEKFQKVINTKQERIMNSMVDTILRGSGLAGAVVSTLKNTINEYYRQEEKGSFMADHTYTLLQLANVSPPIGSKLRKVYGSIQTKNFEKDVIAERGWNLDSPKYEVIGNLLSSGLNIPLDRAVSEVRGITEALDDRNTAYQRLALGLGWRTWDVNAKNEEHELIKTSAKKKRKEEGKIKAAETRKENKKLKIEILNKLGSKDYRNYLSLSTKDRNAFIRNEIKKLKNK